MYSQSTQSQPVLKGMTAPPDEELEVTLVQWLTRECRSQDHTDEALRTWVTDVVTDLLTRRDIHIRTLVEWQHQIATKLRWKLDEIRMAECSAARQAALFDDAALPTSDANRVIRFDDTVYRTVATQPTGAVHLSRHLLGADRVPLIDGSLGGEEFQCAVALDGLDEAEVWVRNVARHPDSFWLPRLANCFYPDFVARLTDGRILLVEYKGEHLVGAPEAKEKRTLGELWAATTSNIFLMVQRRRHGMDPTEQLRRAIGA